MNRRTTRLWRRMRVIILMSAAFLLGMGTLFAAPALVRAKVVERKDDSETGRVSVELQILEMKPIPSPESEESPNVE